jgi:hypothetical protein
MLNVAIGVGSGGGAPRLSGSCPGTGTAEKTTPAPAFTAAGVFFSASAPRVALRRRSAGLAFPETALLNVPRRFPTLGILALFE